MNGQKRDTLAEILLVEDNPGDIRLAQEAFKTAKLFNNLHVVKDGIEAMAFLHQEGAIRSSTAPGPHPARFESAENEWP